MQRWITLILAMSFGAFFAFSFQTLAASSSSVLQDLNLSQKSFGFWMGLFTLPGFLCSLLLGAWSDRYGVKPLALAALSLCVAAATLSATSTFFPLLLLGRFFLGLGCATLLIIAPKAVQLWFTGKKANLAMGIYNISVPLGTVLAFSVFTPIALSLGWRSLQWIAALTALVLGILTLLFYKTHENERLPLSQTLPLRQLLKDLGWPLWFLAAALGLYGAFGMQFFNFGLTFLSEQGVSTKSAARSISAAMWPSFILSPLAGYVMQKYGFKSLWTLGATLGLAVFLFSFTHHFLPWTLGALLLGCSMSIFFAGIYILPGDLCKPQLLGLAYGLYGTTYGGGIWLGAYFTGWLFDHFGAYQAFLTLSLLLFLATPCVFMTHRLAFAKRA